MDLVGPTLYTDHQSGIDDTVPHGWNYYWKATNLTDLSDEVIDVVAEHAYRVRSPRSYAAIFHLGGAVARVPRDATAYPARDVAHNMSIDAVWLADEDETVGTSETGWARAFFQTLQPHCAGVYVNFLDSDDDRIRVREAYGDDTYRRLAEIMDKYDPENVFHNNKNIQPSKVGHSSGAQACRPHPVVGRASIDVGTTPGTPWLLAPGRRPGSAGRSDPTLTVGWIGLVDNRRIDAPGSEAGSWTSGWTGASLRPRWLGGAAAADPEEPGVKIKVIVEFQAKPGARAELASILKGISATHGPSIPGFLGSIVHEVVDSPDTLVEIAEWDSGRFRPPLSNRRWHPGCTHPSSS